MNIAHLLPYSAHFPLKKHNGRYEWVLRLARDQAAKGHRVTVYAAPGSADETAGIAWASLGKDTGDKQFNNISLVKTAFANKTHDIYHSHLDSLHYELADITDKPVVVTQHWFPNETVANAVRLNSKRNVVAVPPTDYMSEADRRMGIPHAETIHHGIDLDLFKPTTDTPDERLIFVGRITPTKGVLEAVRIARLADMPLDIVGKLNDKERGYWETIAPYIDCEQIRYLGPKTLPEVADLMARAKALLFPSQAAEAFGLVTAEAQACGTPVIISGIGASRELVEDGKTGFIAKSSADYVAAIQKIDTIDRRYCRSFAEQFDIQKMFIAYEQLYRQLLGAVDSHKNNSNNGD